MNTRVPSGSNLWGTSRKSSGASRFPMPFASTSNGHLSSRVQDIGDKLVEVLFTNSFSSKQWFEVVGLESAIQMGQIKAGVRAAARRLSQCSTVVIQYASCLFILVFLSDLQNSQSLPDANRRRAVDATSMHNSNNSQESSPYVDW